MGIGCKKDAKAAAELLADFTDACPEPRVLYQLGMLYHSDAASESQAMGNFEAVVEEEPEHKKAWLEMGVLNWKGVPRQ